jgi:hypothetical protein
LRIVLGIAKLDMALRTVENRRADHAIAKTGQPLGDEPHMRIHPKNFLHHDQAARCVHIAGFESREFMSVSSG